jgi:hypothetical protein
MANTGSAILDFGSIPGTNRTITTVTGQTDITNTCFADAFLMGDSTDDHNVEEHLFAPITLRCTNIVPGVSFDIVAITENRLSGTFIVRWVWAEFGSISNSTVGMNNPMTTAGDIIIATANGTPTRLPKGTDGQVLGYANGTVAPITISNGVLPFFDSNGTRKNINLSNNVYIPFFESDGTQKNIPLIVV